jgi:glycosyltransferase involved in cell wall biosynthesis
VVARSGSELCQVCLGFGIKVQPVPNSKVRRLLFELRAGARLTKGSLCFTLFGPPFAGRGLSATNVVGCAYSNLFYPKVDFWQGLPLFERWRRCAVDEVRRWGLRRADYWIFETQALAARAAGRFGFPKERVAVVRMAPSGLVSPKAVDGLARGRFESGFRHRLRFLVLAGGHPNKRQSCLPPIAQKLAAMGVRDFCFVTTMNEQGRYANRVLGMFRAHGMQEHLVNVGPVAAADCASLLDCCSAVCCLSRLGSFSNNFVEAWAMEKPLVATDAEWARAAGGAAAVYVDPEDPAACGLGLARLARDAGFRKDLVEAGKKQLSSYHTPETKYEEYWSVIEKARVLGVCPQGQRRRIWSSNGNG